ncbi:nitroreductase [Rhizobiaceae bacterium BDR2-2]|uniref:Putative NAD(P)H nitroreductase n=1 Tax=Ectorhizobium quercum TaxID=2965071 RepID=A0AAE3MZ45_9HYPH|nr:nitroreductase [Ectorhizobium quercum]MCX8997723.1 nitroreductase [Ectorhizobium quercum]
MPENQNLIEYLRNRRSVPPAMMTSPGPGREEIEALLALASRVPDHGKLAPWRFVVYSRAARERISEALVQLVRQDRPDVSDDAVTLERNRLLLAPVVIGVVSRAAPHPKIPEWEQVLSAGAVCYNLLLAANAHGYAATWLTQWFAYDDRARPLLGLQSGEKVAGFIHIGTMETHPGDRGRPVVQEITSWVES